ncbi:MAG: hypothetical protein FJX75_13660 [Armatimonadetes bacterium]|nr:hypothetical protein [Armatimonadota bacterium]
MKKVLGVYLMVPVACLSVLVAGCAGGGAGGPVNAGSDASSGQVAAAVFVQQWAQILWGLVTSQAHPGQPTAGPPTPNPDGSISQTFTGADGTVTVLTVFPDGSATLNTTYPDGSTQDVTQSVPAYDGVSKTTIDWRIVTSGGLDVTYTSVVDNMGTIFDISDDTTELTGSSVLPDGKTQDFGVLTEGGKTTVGSNQSDGSDFTLDVPLAGPDFVHPDFAQQATGTYRSANYDIRFTLDSTTGAPSRWARFDSDLGSNLTGAFALEKDFAGSGRLLENGRAIALMSWTPTGKTEVNFLGAGRSATSPAGAAVDFLTHRWQTLAGLLAPAPGGASAQTVMEAARG